VTVAGTGTQLTTLQVRWTNSPHEHEGRSGELLATRNHEVIHLWADSRDAAPARFVDVERQGKPLGLAFTFPTIGGREFEQITWEEWFGELERQGTVFIYQETTEEGLASYYYQLVSPDRTAEQGRMDS
jgi:hypothetical protein